jgi:hypothetical protein
MRSSRQTAACLALTACIAASAGQAAEGFIPPGEERFKFNLGGLLYRSETDVRFDGSVGGRQFELEDSLGLDRDRSTLSGQIIWRFASRHRLGLRAFQVKREAERAIDEELRIEDRVVPINTVLRAESRLQFFTADYRYSFVKSPQMELAGIIGVFGGRYRFRFEASNPQIDIERNTTAPMPVLGVSLDWYLGPRWTVSAYAQGMDLDLGSVDARVYNVGLSTEFMLTRHLGLGVAYNLDSVRVDVDKGSFDGRVDLTGGSLIGYLQARF